MKIVKTERLFYSVLTQEIIAQSEHLIHMIIQVKQCLVKLNIEWETGFGKFGEILKYFFCYIAVLNSAKLK